MKYRIPSWVFAFVACLLWSTAFVGVKYSFNFAPPLFVAGLRFLLAGIILIPFAGRGFLSEVRQHYKVIFSVAFLQTFCVYFLYFISLNRIKASTGAALVGLGPMIGAILGHVFIKSDKFTGKKIVSFILGITGVTLVSLSGGENGSLPDTSQIVGITLFVLSSVAGGFSNVVVLKHKSGVRPSVLTSAQLTIGGFFLLLLSLIVYRDISLKFPIEFYFALAWLIFVSSAGFSMWYYLLAKRKENLINMNIWKFIMPVTGGVLGWIIMPNDSPNIKSIMGMIVVALSIFVFYYKPKNQSAQSIE